MPGPAFLSDQEVSLHTVELTDGDIQIMQEWINAPKTRQPMGIRHPFSMSEEYNWLEETIHSDDHILFFVCVDGESQPVGNVELFNIDTENGRAEIGCWIYEGHRRNGYATAACELLVEYAFDELCLHRLDAVTSRQNTASKELLENLGFNPEGAAAEAMFLQGEYIDELHYGRLATSR